MWWGRGGLLRNAANRKTVRFEEVVSRTDAAVFKFKAERVAKTFGSRCPEVAGVALIAEAATAVSIFAREWKIKGSVPHRRRVITSIA